MIQLFPAPIDGVIGHRGAQDCAPENTLAAIDAAYRLGANWVEIDIQLTRDHQWVVFHDDTLERAAGNSAYLADCTLAELQNIKIFGDHKIPTLSEVLQVVWAHKGVVNLEVKIDPIVEDWQPLFIEKTIEVVNTWPVHQSRPLISSFNHKILHHLFTTLPGQPLGFLMEDIDSELVRWCARHAERVSINFQHNRATEADFALLRHAHLSSYAYTVNDVERAAYLRQQGISGVFTDIPQSLLTQTAPD